jgi:phosphatidylinositol alpha-mannosyltransferase
MKVALVSPYALNVFGGVQEQVLGMSRTLSNRGHQVLIVAPNENDRQKYDTPATVMRIGEVTSVPANGSRAPLALKGQTSVAVATALRNFDPDVVHLHEPLAPRFGWSTLRGHDCALVGTFHRSGVSVLMRAAGPWLRSLAGELDVTVAVSASAAHTAHEAYGVDPTVLFNGFETERFTLPERRLPSVPALITIGRLEERKGTVVAIEAVLGHNKKPAAEPWRLLVVGSGPLEAELRQRYANPAITFLGAVSDAQKRQLLRESSVALCPALRGESFGVVLLEAMAAQLRVVASDIEGYAAAASTHAELFKPGDPVAMERAIEVALGAGRDDIDAAARHAQQWSMTALVEQYELLYESAQRTFQSR